MTRHLTEYKFDYSLHQQSLEEVQTAKYLCITIISNLDWGQHISVIPLMQLGLWVFFGETWHLHLGRQRMLHIELCFGLN